MPVASVGAPAAGIRRRDPAMTIAVGLRPLAPASAAVDRPLAAAMPESVSPGRTTRPPPGAAGVAVPSGCAEPPPGDGTCSVVPVMTKAVGRQAVGRGERARRQAVGGGDARERLAGGDRVDVRGGRGGGEQGAQDRGAEQA